MELGVVFPTHEIGNDPIAIRDFAQAAEGAGYTRLVAYDHVLGAHPDRPAGEGPRTGPYGGAAAPPYTHATAFHEPFVLFGYLAGLTSRIGLMTGVLVLPQRQTALVAKPCAELDLLSGGRLVLGAGVGWNAVEFGALGEDFRTRGRRMEEQIGLLRRLWTEPLVRFEGEFDSIPESAVCPRPGRPIPIWIGGHAPAVMDRVGRLGDGWVAGWAKPDYLAERIALIGEAARAAGRDPAAIAIETRARAARWSPAQQADHARRCEAAGATHFALHTLEAGFASVGEHIEALRAFREEYGRGA